MTLLAPAVAAPDPYMPDTPYAWLRLGLALLIAMIVGVGTWGIVVVLPDVQADFGIQRGEASVAYTATMLGFAFGTILMGRMVDRVGIAIPILIAGVCLGSGLAISGMAPDILVFSAAHGLLVGFGAGTGFAPMMADITHWFVKRRGFALVVVASGNYLAGAVWPIVLKLAVPEFGWRTTYIAIGILVVVTVTPLALFFRRRPAASTMAAADAASEVARADLGMSPQLCRACWSPPAFPAVWPCRCRRCTSSPIAAISATGSRAARKCSR